MTGAGVLAVMVMLSAEAAAVDGNDGAGIASVDATDAKDVGSDITPFTRRGSSCCLAETSPAWDIARSAEIAPEGAEDGCKKF